MDQSQSWMDIAATLGALVDTNGRAIPASCTRVGIEHIVVGCDLGNSALKLALRQAHAPQLRTLRFDAIYTPAATIRAGEGATAYRVLRNAVWREWFWLDQADATNGEALPIGVTAERLADPRLIDFLVGALVDALHQSGRAPGSYSLWLGLGIPNEDVQRTGVDAATRQALWQLRGQPFLVERRDPNGAVTTWKLTIGELVPAPQSLGSFIAWYHSLAGHPIDEMVDLVTVADLGGGHLSRFDVEIVRRAGAVPQFRGTGSIIGEGLIVVARELAEVIRAHYRIRLNETAALRALMTHTIPAGGRRLAIDDLIAHAIHTRGQQLLAALTPLLADQRRWLLFVGGGAVCLSTELETRAAAAQHLPGSYLIAPASIAASANAVGLFALALYAAERGV
jgi:hypothetical protein